MTAKNNSLRSDLRLIADMIEPDSRVLDIGCDDGALLDFLVHNRAVSGRGVELSQKGVNLCVARGLSVIQGNADTDLQYYPDDAFDYAILSQTIQATNNPRHVLEELLRIGQKAIVSFPNFGHWRVRSSLAFAGRMPVTQSLSFQWYETPNIHFCTVDDFFALCQDMNIRIAKTLFLDERGRQKKLLFPNLTAQQAIFFLHRK
ncbi:methionine biosynthesis protein MetW [Kiloniella laminariae]|uniref:Methionine biosynthesis protein MetW n=1 Tax=Kiloniella laminariae TaxID=454162 RepID=A0ABT4LKJ4_9PROT|nr:methionine biosynthesis protein MetW [Kiloniella laminariae]MCZ4281632.1 methionine biosynthesis protein MetW [Kiloniella laminariae]